MTDPESRNCSKEIAGTLAVILRTPVEILKYMQQHRQSPRARVKESWGSEHCQAELFVSEVLE